ncbi:MAG: T9SS type A sorting domain-containing protein [Bacteroidota bacterium]|nr:T9SS type A sorting domain-containing protein [Bacteroidota bacterium]
MKKTLLLTFTFIFYLTGIINAQSLVLSTEETGELENGQIVKVETTPNAGTIDQHFHVINNNDEALDIKVKKIENSLIENSVNYFCWGSCFAPFIYESPTPVTIEGNTTNENDFSSDYSPSGGVGTSSITYVFFDTNNPEDSTYIVVNYISKNLTLSTEDEGELTDGQEITVHTTADDALAIKHVFVTNTSDETINVKVKKIEDEILENSTNTFCWDACYGTTVFESRDPIAIAANTTNETNFSADYSANNNGTSYITYVFFNNDNIQDSVSVVIKFTTETDGIDEHYFVKHLNAYPVPANDYLYIDYDIDNCKNISLKITNILGAEIKNQQITQTSGKIKLNTSELKNGLYFYTIYNNNQPLSTKKIIIKH